MNAHRRIAAGALSVLLLVAASACAGTPGPGEAGYPFNVTGTYSGQFVVEGQGIGATLTLETRAGGVIAGQVRVAEMGISSEVSGTLAGDQLTLRIPYHNPGNGCDGVAETTATVTDGGASFSGALTVTECGQGMGGSVSFRRS